MGCTAAGETWAWASLRVSGGQLDDATVVGIDHRDDAVLSQRVVRLVSVGQWASEQVGRFVGTRVSKVWQVVVRRAERVVST